MQRILTTRTVETLKALQALDLSTWKTRVKPLLEQQSNLPEPADEIDRRMRDQDGDWLHFDGYGSLASLRALLDAFPEAREVKMNVSDLIDGGYIDAGEAICNRRRESDHSGVRDLAPTVILGEGSSDIDILQKSLVALFPEVKDYFSFLDHRELSFDGGASYVVKFLKAFAAAGAPMRVIAIFDNDVAGVQAFKQTLALKMPQNIAVLTLPDIALAKKYPTVGPMGEGIANVNGRAASIELYLGRASLVDARGNLRPVRGTGYVAPFNIYQGEVEGKSAYSRGLPQGHPDYSEPGSCT